MYNNNLIAKSVRFALISGAGAAALAAPVVLAAEESAEVERITVTGSRIKRADMETASPVTIIDASAISASGATSIDDVLQKMTASGGQMMNSGVNNGSEGNAGINLRGLGEERTLVLVNGRRMIASGTGAASSVDLNTIPVSMIQRIEVLKDGASAVYGTDAIAGVVNVILKRDFDGFEMNVQTGMSGQGDADETSIDFTLGNTFDKGNVVINAQYTSRGEARQVDRASTKCPLREEGDGTAPYCGGSLSSEGGHINGDSNHGIVKTGTDKLGQSVYANGDAGYYGKYVQRLKDDGSTWLDGDGKSNDAFYQSWEVITSPNSDSGSRNPYYDNSIDPTLGQRKVANVSVRGGSYHDFTDEDRYDHAKESYLSTPMERLNLSFSGTYELADSITFFSEAMYSKRWSQQQLASQPIRNDLKKKSWVYDPSWMTNELVGSIQAGEALSYLRRMSESGTRNLSQTVDTIRLVVGLEGEFDNGWMWDASYNKGKNDSVYTTENLHNMGSIHAAVLAEEFDPFLQSSWQGENIAPYIYTEVNSGGTELDIMAVTLTGDMFELPAGVMGFAAGMEHRKESAHNTPDSLKAQGLSNDDRVEATAGSFDVNEVYAELAITLLSDLPFAQQVDLSTAIRYFDYSTFCADNTWKLGLTWRMTDDLMLRGMTSTAFRAPTVKELYGGKKTSYEYITHKATKVDQGQVTIGGNPTYWLKKRISPR